MSAGLRQKIVELARTPLDARPPRRNRRGELVRQQVSLPVRLLAGAGALVFAGFAGMPGQTWEFSSSLPVAIGAWIALFGVKTIVVDPEASDEFLRAADPDRPLPGSSNESGNAPVSS